MIIQAISYSLILILCAGSAVNAEMLTATLDEKLVVAPISSSHPRLWVNEERLDFLQDAYRQKRDPFFTPLLKMVQIARGNLASEINIYESSDFREWMVKGYGDGRVAVCMAVAYHITGEESYKEKAAEIILARTGEDHPLGEIDRNVAPLFSNLGLFTITGSSGLIYAYDLLSNADAFTVEQKEAIEQWIRALVPVIKEGIKRWDTPFKKVSTETDPRGWIETRDERDRYFGGQYYQNHPGTHLMGILMIGYVLGDRDLVQYGLDSDENPRDLKEMIEGAIHVEGTSDFVRFERARVLQIGEQYGLDLSLADWHYLPPQTGEIYDRYRTISGNGFGYSKHGFKMLLFSAELAYQNGINFYQFTGRNGENLLLPFDFYKDFIVIGDNRIKGGYYVWSPMNDNVASGFAELYELGLRRYPKHRDLFLSVLELEKYNRGDDSLPPVHNPILSWLIAFGD